MLDSRKNTLTKKSFSSDLENWLFRFATVDGIESLVLDHCHQNSLMTRATVARKRAGLSNINGLKAVRKALASILSGRTVVLKKNNFRDLSVTFRKVGKTLEMTAERTVYVMNFGDFVEPAKYLRLFNDYECFMKINEETENDEDYEE